MNLQKRFPPAHARTPRHLLKFFGTPGRTGAIGAGTRGDGLGAWWPFWMGGDDGSMADSGPVHELKIFGFWIDRTEVTNRQFGEFVKATNYQTIAERKPDAKDYPGAPLEKLVPGSIVFTPPAGRVSLDDPSIWWRYVPGANWRHPSGTRQHDSRKGRPSGCAGLLVRCPGLCELGTKTSADRSRVGVCLGAEGSPVRDMSGVI